MKLIGTTNAILIGQAKSYTRPNTLSAIGKQPIAGSIHAYHDGLDGDEQGDRRAHGGPDKAVHFYPLEYYDRWRRELGNIPLLEAPGAFGENISTLGMTEHDLCIGDQLAIGNTLLEISQPRQPCWKLNDRLNVPDMALRMQQNLRTGFYCRVTTPGTLIPGDQIVLVARPHPEWTLWRLLDLLYHHPLDRQSLESASALPLVPSWQNLIANRLASGLVEDWSNRLNGPSRSPA